MNNQLVTYESVQYESVAPYVPTGVKIPVNADRYDQFVDSDGNKRMRTTAEVSEIFSKVNLFITKNTDPKYNLLKNVYIAGGSVVNALTLATPLENTDIDVYITSDNKVDFEETIEYLLDRHMIRNSTKLCIRTPLSLTHFVQSGEFSELSDGKFVAKTINVQFILIKAKTIDEILDNFDMSQCKCAFNMFTNKVYMTEDCVASLKSKSFNINDTNNSEHRIKKYFRKGFDAYMKYFDQTKVDMSFDHGLAYLLKDTESNKKYMDESYGYEGKSLEADDPNDFKNKLVKKNVRNIIKRYENKNKSQVQMFNYMSKLKELLDGTFDTKLLTSIKYYFTIEESDKFEYIQTFDDYYENTIKHINLIGNNLRSDQQRNNWLCDANYVPTVGPVVEPVTKPVVQPVTKSVVKTVVELVADEELYSDAELEDDNYVPKSLINTSLDNYSGVVSVSKELVIDDINVEWSLFKQMFDKMEQKFNKYSELQAKYDALYLSNKNLVTEHNSAIDKINKFRNELLNL